MKCGECLKKGETSRVYPGCTTATAMYCPEFYDEEGALHRHDLNTYTTRYTCSKGHEWVDSRKKKCPACNWPEELPNG